MSDDGIVLVNSDRELIIPRAYTNISVSYNTRGDKGQRGDPGPAGALSGYETDAMFTSDTAAIEALISDIEVTDRGAWINYTPINGWNNFNGGHRTMRYRKIDRMVYLEGMIIKGGVSNTFANLPVGYRPSAPIVITAFSRDGTGAKFASRFDAATNGDLSWVVGGTFMFAINNTCFPV